MKGVARISLLLLVLITSGHIALAAIPTIYTESPALSIVLSGFSRIGMRYTQFSLFSTDIYQTEVFTPLAPIILVDTGVEYNQYTANYFHYCRFTGFAPAGLIDWLNNHHACIAPPVKITLSKLAQVLASTYGTSTLQLIDEGKSFTIPQSETVYEVCVTTSQKLASLGIYVGTTTSEEGDTADTIVIMQPTAWNDDLYGHGTATASALCGKLVIPIKDTTSNTIANLVMYTGAATGAHIYVVNVGAYAIILPDYDILSDARTRDAVIPRLENAAKASNEAVEEAFASQALLLLFEAARRAGSIPMLDYKFQYLGPTLAAIDVINSLGLINNTLAQYLQAETYKPIALINVAVKVKDDNTSYGATKLCEYLKGNMTIRTNPPLVVVAPTGNDFSIIDTVLNKNGIYIWPAQCTYFIAGKSIVNVRIADFQTVPAEGTEIIINSTDGRVILLSNPLTASNFYGNYYSENVDADPLNTTYSKAYVVVAEPAATFGQINISNVNIGGTSYNIVLKFNGVPIFYPCGSIMAADSQQSCNYGEALIVPEGNVEGSNIIVNINGYNGTSFAAAYAAALATLTVFDNPIATTPSQAAEEIANALVGGYVTNFTASNIWDYVLAVGGIVTGYPSTNFPYKIPANSIYLFGGAFPAGGGSSGSAAIGETSTTTMGNTIASVAPVSTAMKPQPQIVQVNFPGVALLAPLFSKIFARKRSKKTSKKEKQ